MQSSIIRRTMITTTTTTRSRKNVRMLLLPRRLNNTTSIIHHRFHNHLMITRRRLHQKQEERLCLLQHQNYCTSSSSVKITDAAAAIDEARRRQQPQRRRITTRSLLSESKKTSLLLLRRGFTTTTTTASTSSTTPTTSNNNNVDRVGLERFTLQVLKSPNTFMRLGTMTNQQWDDIVAAIEAWIDIYNNNGDGGGGGYAIDSAERLIQRLILEVGVIIDQSNKIKQDEVLFLLQESIVYSWYDIITKKNNNNRNNKSKMALHKTTNALNQYFELEEKCHNNENHNHDDNNNNINSSSYSSSSLPILNDIYIAILNGWLDFETIQTTYQATDLLLALTTISTTNDDDYDDDNNDINNNNNHDDGLASILFPYFNRALSQLISFRNDDDDGGDNNDAETTIYDDNNVLLFSNLIDRMELLSQKPEWSGLQIPEEVYYRSSNQKDNGNTSSSSSLPFDSKTEDYASENNNSIDDAKGDGRQQQQQQQNYPKKTSFEMDALEQRIIDFVKLVNNNSAEAVETVKTDLSRLLGNKYDKQRLNQLQRQPSDELIQNLVEFYIRVDDPDNASYWLQIMVEKQKDNITTSTQQQDNNHNSTSLLLFENLVQLWLKNSGDDKRAPWKADETFRKVLDSVEIPMVNENGNDDDDYSKTKNGHDDSIHNIVERCFQSMFQIWTDSQDPSASRKCRELYALMDNKGVVQQAGTEALCRLLKMHVRQKNPNAAKELLKQIFQGWDNRLDDEKNTYAESIINIAVETNAPKIAMRLLLRMKEDNFQPSDLVFRSSLQLISTDTMKPTELIQLVDVLTGFKFHVDHHLTIYKRAILALMDGHIQSVAKDVDSLFNQALVVIRSERETIDPKLVGEFLSSVIKRLASYMKLHDAAEKYLMKAEDALLLIQELEEEKIMTENNNNNKVSLIPLECYRQVIKRKWHSNRNKPTTSLTTFERLIHFYKKGYTNLKPDGDIIGAYIKAKLFCIEDPNEIDNILDNVMSQMGGNSCDLYGVDIDAYNHLLKAYRDQSDANTLSQKSLALLDRLVALGSIPNTKTINIVMQNVIRGGVGGGRERNTYRIILTLFQKFKTYDLDPDLYSYHAILEACATANPGDHEQSLHMCINTLATIRRHSMVCDSTYYLILKVVSQVNLNSTQGKRDKVAATILNSCCEDGMLNSYERKQLRRLMSKWAWEKFYTGRLLEDGTEPLEWSRSLPHGKDAA